MKMLVEIDSETQVVVPKVPAVSNEMKVKFIGEFGWSKSLENDNDEVAEYTVPWRVCKEIFHRMAQHWIEAAPPPEPVQPSEMPFSIAPDETAALSRFCETCDDGQGYDVPKAMMKQLSAIGLIRRTTRDIYEITEFGAAVNAGKFCQQPAQPIPTGERLPNENELVVAWDGVDNCYQLMTGGEMRMFDAVVYPHWLPTGLTRPSNMSANQ